MVELPKPCASCGSQRTWASGGHKYGCAVWAAETGTSLWSHGNDGYGNPDPLWGDSPISEYLPTTDAEWADMCNPNEGCK